MNFSDELKQAWEFIEFTDRNVFLTGKAGTGKTTFLRYLVANSTKRCVVVAPTGVAAINAGGVTIHSFFQIDLGPFTPGTKQSSKFNIRKEKLRIIRSLDLLVIDEISMVRSDLLDAVDDTLRRVRRSDRPFGGVQLLMIGDLGQLTPVVKHNEEHLLEQFYDTPYFFGSRALRSTDYVTIELTTVYRQQDKTFLGILNHIRDGRPTADDLATLNARYLPNFQPADDEGYIRLTTHNAFADSYNEKRMDEIDAPTHTFVAHVDGTFPEQVYPTSERLQLKEGAQVMFLKNDSSGAHLYYNGKIGRITHIDDEDIYVSCPGDDDLIKVEPETWENSKYEINEETKEMVSTVVGTFQQYPLRLAWAITIHKSQGLTFDRAVIDASRSFAPGQMYVALSRCRTLEGMVLSSPVSLSSIITDHTVGEYLSHQEEATRQSVQLLPMLRDEYEKTLMLELFDFKKIGELESSLIRVVRDLFYHSNPSLVELHSDLYGQFYKEVIDIADVWCGKIRSSDLAVLRSDAFLERVKKSCGYFREKLETTIVRILDATKGVESGNKEMMKRLKSIFDDLNDLCNTKVYVLREMEENGYTVADYLKAKQLSWASDIEREEERKRKKKEAKKAKKSAAKALKSQKQEALAQRVLDAAMRGEVVEIDEDDVKLPNGVTKQITLNLFRSGMTIPQICKARSLKPQTVQSHLAHFIETGDLSVDEFVDDDTYKLIADTVERLGLDDGLAMIKNACPDDLTYAQITMVIADMKKEGIL